MKKQLSLALLIGGTLVAGAALANQDGGWKNQTDLMFTPSVSQLPATAAGPGTATMTVKPASTMDYGIQGLRNNEASSKR